MTLEVLKSKIGQINLNNLSIGYSELDIATVSNFDEFQLGFSIDTNGKKLTGKSEGEWADHWYVVAVNEIGDPHFVDLKSNQVCTAPHGEGVWFANLISSSFESYVNTLNYLNSISKNRENPDDLESNPFSDSEIEDFEKFIHIQNNAEIDFSEWEYWVENE
jgi:hypothetical protein